MGWLELVGAAVALRCRFGGMSSPSGQLSGLFCNSDLRAQWHLRQPQSEHWPHTSFPALLAPAPITGRRGFSRRETCQQRAPANFTQEHSIPLFVRPSCCSKYREAGFYVSHMPEDNDASEKFYGLGDAGFKDAVMDLTAEDAG